MIVAQKCIRRKNHANKNEDKMAANAKKTTTSAASTATSAMDQMANSGADMFKDNFEKMMKSMTQFTDFQKETLEAMMESVQTLNKGLETISSEALGFQKKQMEEGVAAAKSVSGAKSLHDLIEVNSDFMKSYFEGYVGQLSKLSDLATTTVKDAGEPMNERYTAFVEMVQSYRP